MRGPRAYTIEQLSKRSGFDRRTIAYYTTVGLLPKVGRRGPRTTYPQSVLDRLLLIRRVRDMQQQGQLTGVTLRDMAQRMSSMSDEELAQTRQRAYPAEELLALFDDGSTVRDASAEQDSYVTPRMLMGDALVGRSPAHDEADPDADTAIEEELASLFRAVDERARVRPAGDASGETLYRVPITDDVLLTVRNIDKKDASLVERMAALLRRLTRRSAE